MGRPGRSCRAPPRLRRARQVLPPRRARGGVRHALRAHLLCLCHRRGARRRRPPPRRCADREEGVRGCGVSDSLCASVGAAVYLFLFRSCCHFADDLCLPVWDCPCIRRLSSARYTRCRKGTVTISWLRPRCSHHISTYRKALNTSQAQAERVALNTLHKPKLNAWHITSSL